LADLSGFLRDIQIPDMYVARQKFPKPCIENIEKHLVDALDRVFPEKGNLDRLRIAVTAGSRGITSIPEIHRIIGDYLKMQAGKRRTRP